MTSPELDCQEIVRIDGTNVPFSRLLQTEWRSARASDASMPMIGAKQTVRGKGFCYATNSH
ncbi:MAG: hypothetical protein ACQZ3N_08705 [cyanobacterium endosymbiont of Rhopalodia yunnanensis]